MFKHNKISRPLTNYDCPDINEHEESNICKFLQWEQECEYMVRDALCKTIQRVKSVTGVWGGHNPLVMRFMEYLVNQWMMQPSMDPIDAEICKHYEKWKLEYVIQWKGGS